MKPEARTQPHPHALVTSSATSMSPIRRRAVLLLLLHLLVLLQLLVCLSVLFPLLPPDSAPHRHPPFIGRRNMLLGGEVKRGERLLAQLLKKVEKGLQDARVMDIAC